MTCELYIITACAWWVSNYTVMACVRSSALLFMAGLALYTIMIGLVLVRFVHSLCIWQHGVIVYIVDDKDSYNITYFWCDRYL